MALASGAPPAVVLEEDDFTGVLESIVERDFFPDLPRLRARLGWLAAARRGDGAGAAAAAAALAADHLRRTPGGPGAPVATPSFGSPARSSAGGAGSAAAGATPSADDAGRSAAQLAAALAAAAAAAAGGTAAIPLLSERERAACGGGQ